MPTGGRPEPLGRHRSCATGYVWLVSEGRGIGDFQRRHGDGTTYLARFYAYFLKPPRSYCTMLRWKGSPGVKTLTSRTGLSSMSVWVPRKATSRTSADGVRFSQVSTLFKLYELCMWEVLDKELRPLPGQIFGFRPWRQCSDIVSFLVEGCKKPKSGAKKCS